MSKLNNKQEKRVVRVTFEGNGQAAFLWNSVKRRGTIAGLYAIGPGSTTSENASVNAVNPMFEGMPGVRRFYHFDRPTLQQLKDIVNELCDFFEYQPPLLASELHLPTDLREALQGKLEQKDWELVLRNEGQDHTQERLR